MILQMHQSHNANEAGGKAAALAALVTAGFDVPEFITLTSQAFSCDPSAPEPTTGLSERLTKALESLGPGPFAVRSSGRAEDGAQHSHAGQFDTHLNVEPADVLQAAAQVWASGFGETVNTYRDLATGDAPEAPAILIQRMVPARIAGVAFSADPVSGLRGTAVISAVEGLGEALVAGEVDGEDWSVTQTAHPPETPSVLTPEEAEAIAALARQCEAHFGCPQDIEWAYDGPRLMLLQSRAITTPLRDGPLPDTALTVFDNSNIVESYPGLVSPLTFSFAAYSYDRVYRAFVALLGLRQGEIAANAAIFQNLLGRVDGRVYYNLGNWYRALALLPGFALNRGYMETMMGVDEALPEALTKTIGPPPAQGLAKLTAYTKLAGVGFGLIWQAIRLPATRRGFYARLNKALKTSDTKGLNLTQLAAAYRRIEADLLDQWDAPLVNDFLCMIGFGASRALLTKWAGAAGGTFHNDFMIGQGDIVSAEPAQRIAALSAMVRQAGPEALDNLDEHPQITEAIDSYLQKFGDRCTEELKLESIPLTEDPSSLLAAVRAGASRPPQEHAAKPAPDWAGLIANPVKRFAARKLSEWARNRVRDRENLRFERTRIFGLARRMFLAMGRELTALGHLDAPRDVLMLTVPEVLSAIEGGMLSLNLKPLVTQRKAEMTAAATRPDPPARITTQGAAITLPITAAAATEETGNTRQGTGCSAGEVTARAAVIRDPRTESLTAGDILVARNTDPGWIAVFSNASAIVVERGSLLSHSAIVARELGIPCVVGLKNACNWVQTGDTLTVNGASGEVQKQ